MLEWRHLHFELNKNKCQSNIHQIDLNKPKNSVVVKKKNCILRFLFHSMQKGPVAIGGPSRANIGFDHSSAESIAGMTFTGEKRR